MTSTHRHTLRFAAGSPEEYRSAVWRLWVQGNEIYLGARHLGGLIKLSMHGSGIWRLAWTDRSGIKAPHSTDRVEQRWQRPPEFRLGWTQGPAVIIPNTGIERPFRHGKEDVDDVAWVPTPAPGKKHHITVLLASRGATPKSWSEVVRPTDATLGVLDLRTGDRVLLCQREIPMVEKEASFVLPFVKDMRINYDLEVPEDVQASVFSAGTDDDGHPYLIDMPLGWENVTGPTGAASGLTSA